MHRSHRCLLAVFFSVALIAAAAPRYIIDERSERPSRDEAARFMGELMAGGASIGGPLELEDQHGMKRSLADFRGAVVLLYFGYVSCPDICPTDLAAVAEL